MYCAVGNIYVCVSHVVCYVVFISLGGISVHVLSNAMSHVVCCVNYVIHIHIYTHICMVWYSGVCVFLSALCVLCGMCFLSASSVLALTICEHGFLGSTEKSFHPVTAVSMSHGRDEAYEIPSVV